MKTSSVFFKIGLLQLVVCYLALPAFFSIALAKASYAVDWAKNDIACTRTIPAYVTENPSGYYSRFAVAYRSTKDGSAMIIFDCLKTSNTLLMQQQFSCSSLVATKGAYTFSYASPVSISSAAALTAYDACEYVFTNAKIVLSSNDTTR